MREDRVQEEPIMVVGKHLYLFDCLKLIGAL